MARIKELTSESYWRKYWKSKLNIDKSIIGPDLLFHDILEKYIPKSDAIRFLEVGGYPGLWAIYFAKFWGADAALVDRYADRDVIKSLGLVNGINNIDVIEGDIFQLSIDKKFNVVMSAGFIEHFSDASLVVAKHIDFLEDDGILVLTVPNFLGLNGLLQKIFDRETYNTHYLDVMYAKRLQRIVSSKGMQISYIGYYGKFAIWLENINTRSVWLGRAFYIANTIGKLLVRFESRLFSPYLVVVAKRS